MSKIAEAKADGIYSSVVIKRTKEGKVDVSGNVRVLCKKTDKGLSCYMSGFDIFFFAKDEETRKKKSLIFVKFYLDNFLLFSNKNSVRKLVLDLNKKGFRADNHNAVMFELVNNRTVPAKFRVLKPFVPLDFKDADEFSEKFEIAA